MRIVLRGIGVVGGFGCGVAELSEALHGNAGCPVSFPLSVGSQPREIPVFRADTSRLESFVPARTLRRIDHYSRLGLLGSYLALTDAGLAGEDRNGLGVVVATGHGATGITFAYLNSFIHDGDICASPTHFANSLHNSAASNISILLGATGPNLTVSQLDLSVPSALLTARQWLLEGRVDRLLFGAIDEMSELMGYVWHRQRGTPVSATMTPLRTEAETAIPAEGAAFFLFAREEGNSDGYCTLDEVLTGNQPEGNMFRRAPELLVLAADGRPDVGRQYAARAANARVACYTPIYGSTPAGPAFDLAAAALILKDGIVFASPGGDACDFPATVASADEPFDGATIDCLTLTPDGGYGLITVGRR